MYDRQQHIHNMYMLQRRRSYIFNLLENAALLDSRCCDDLLCRCLSERAPTWVWNTSYTIILSILHTSYLKVMVEARIARDYVHAVDSISLSFRANGKTVPNTRRMPLHRQYGRTVIAYQYVCICCTVCSRRLVVRFVLVCFVIPRNTVCKEGKQRSRATVLLVAVRAGRHALQTQAIQGQTKNVQQ